MHVRVLGSAAGGGFPQWNCGCINCRGLRERTVRATARTQESVAISADRVHWFLLNASPEIRAQIESFPPLWPRNRRDTPIAGILLNNGDLDHCLGLLSLRESHPMVVYATDTVRRGFTEGNVLYRTLQRFPQQVTWRPLVLGLEQPLLIGRDEESGLAVTAIQVPGKRPLHLESPGPGQVSSPEDNVGLIVRDTRSGRRLAYFSAVGDWSTKVERAVASADCVFFDGTFWSSDELNSSGVGERSAEDMAHFPVGGVDGTLSRLQQAGGRRRVLIHINNTNPILCEDSLERRTVNETGIEVAFDGMEFVL